MTPDPEVWVEGKHYRAVLIISDAIVYTARGDTPDAASAACLAGFQNARRGQFGVLDWKPKRRYQKPEAGR